MGRCVSPNLKKIRRNKCVSKHRNTVKTLVNEGERLIGVDVCVIDKDALQKDNRKTKNTAKNENIANKRVTVAENGKASRGSSTRRWIMRSVCLCFVDLLLIYLLVLEGSNIISEIDSYKQLGNKSTNVIVPCDDVSLSIEEDEVIFDTRKTGVKVYVDENGKYICSFKNWTTVIEKVTERASRIRLAKGLTHPRYLSCGNVRKAPAPGYLTAYFTRLSINKTRKDKGRGHLLLWNQNFQDSYTGPGISYRDGKIRVNTTQYYYVYASVSFDNGIILDNKSRTGSCLFTVFVLKGHVGYDGEFERIQLKRSKMLHNATSGVVTIHLGSHFLLESDKEFYVKVTDADRLVDTSASNMFGLFPYD